MTTDYDPIAEQYRLAKQQPWRACIEAYTFMNLIGDLSGKEVIDLACGEGFYSRMIRQKGAAEVTGLDLSPRMIELASAREAEQPLGIDYFVGDARHLDGNAPYDLAVAAYLLNYAEDRAQLSLMCNSISRCLKPGGRFVTVNSSPLLDFPSAPDYHKYGFEAHVRGPWGEGAPITWSFFLDGGSFDIENYFLDAAIHEEAFRAAGFREIRWHPPRLSPEGETAYPRGYWDVFLQHSPIAFIECLK
jgi:ubiquinone/menaquinone biosynthesis C-methylase UbiE